MVEEKEKKEAKGEEQEDKQKNPTAPAKTGQPWLAVIAVIVLTPLASFCVTQFVIIPKIKGAAVEHQATAATDAANKNGAGKNGKADDKTYSYEFQSIVVNLAGTMGTRYLKVTFTIFSSNPDLQKVMTDNKPQLLDIALNVLSSRTLADLELAGAKNLVRNDLTTSFNQALNGNVVSQIYFSEFVVQ